MGIGAIVLGVFAFVCTIGGALLAWVPFLGTMLSFLAPVLALSGIILGGVALSRAKAGAGESEGLAIGGLVTSIVAFIPALIVALTCGLCNTCTTAMYLDPSIGAYDSGVHDAGMVPNRTIPPAPPPFPAGPTPGLVPTSPAPLAPASAVPTSAVPTSAAPTSAAPTSPGQQGAAPPFPSSAPPAGP